MCHFLKRSWHLGSIVLKFINIHVTQRSQSVSKTTSCEYGIGNSRTIFQWIPDCDSAHKKWRQVHFVTSQKFVSTSDSSLEHWSVPWNVKCSCQNPPLFLTSWCDYWISVILTWWSPITGKISRRLGWISEHWSLVDMLHACWRNKLTTSVLWWVI